MTKKYRFSKIKEFTNKLFWGERIPSDIIVDIPSPLRYFYPDWAN